MLPYSQILNKLFNINQFEGMKLGLKNCHELDALLGKPSQAFPSIHIAGTNGKGSVSTKLAAAHQASGLKVGLFTSPHIACFRERIRINGQMISEENVEKHLNSLFKICQEHAIKATFFELTTMLAFIHFAMEKVDIAVLEVGLGGRLDATNIAKTVLSVITSISLEHTEILGNTIEAITAEKAGIIKPSVPVVIGPTVPKNIIESIARQKQSICYQVEGEFKSYHDENCAVAKKACRMLGLSITATEKGLKALPPCRLEVFSKEDLLKAGYSLPLPKEVILDVAHNPDGLKQLIKAIKYKHGETPFRLVIGLSNNKDIRSCLQTIKNEINEWHLVQADNSRAFPKERLAKELMSLGISKENIHYAGSIEDEIKQAIASAGDKNEIVVVCGTFFIMKETRKLLGICEPHDLWNMNELHSAKV